jgi:hypothetical protein
VACWARNWTSKLKETQETVILELSFAGQTSVGLEALRWFLKQPVHKGLLQSVAGFFPLYDNPLVKGAILSSIGETADENDNNLNWINTVVHEGVNDPSLQVRAKTLALLEVLIDEREYVNIIDYDEEFISKLIEIGKEDLIESSLQNIFYRLHLEAGGTDHDDSRISGILEKLLDYTSHFVRLAAAELLGNIAPDIFLNELNRRIKLSNGNMPQIMINEYASGVDSVVNQYDEKYYGSMCPGYLEYLKEDAEALGTEALYEEYLRMYKLCSPIIAFYPTKDFSRRLRGLLEALKPALASDALAAYEIEDKEVIAQRNALRYQLPLPFDDLDTNREGN